MACCLWLYSAHEFRTPRFRTDDVPCSTIISRYVAEHWSHCILLLRLMQVGRRDNVRAYANGRIRCAILRGPSRPALLRPALFPGNDFCGFAVALLVPVSSFSREEGRQLTHGAVHSFLCWPACSKGGLGWRGKSVLECKLGCIPEGTAGRPGPFQFR